MYAAQDRQFIRRRLDIGPTVELLAASVGGLDLGLNVHRLSDIDHMALPDQKADAAPDRRERLIIRLSAINSGLIGRFVDTMISTLALLIEGNPAINRLINQGLNRASLIVSNRTKIF